MDFFRLFGDLKIILWFYISFECSWQFTISDDNILNATLNFELIEGNTQGS